MALEVDFCDVTLCPLDMLYFQGTLVLEKYKQRLDHRKTYFVATCTGIIRAIHDLPDVVCFISLDHRTKRPEFFHPVGKHAPAFPELLSTQRVDKRLRRDGRNRKHVGKNK